MSGGSRPVFVSTVKDDKGVRQMTPVSAGVRREEMTPRYRRRLKMEELIQRREVLTANMEEIEKSWGNKPKDHSTLEVIMMLGLEIAQVETQMAEVERETAAIQNLAKPLRLRRDAATAAAASDDDDGAADDDDAAPAESARKAADGTRKKSSSAERSTSVRNLSTAAAATADDSAEQSSDVDSGGGKATRSTKAPRIKARSASQRPTVMAPSPLKPVNEWSFIENRPGIQVFCAAQMICVVEAAWY
jgi:hypothetical protein